MKVNKIRNLIIYTTINKDNDKIAQKFAFQQI